MRYGPPEGVGQAEGAVGPGQPLPLPLLGYVSDIELTFTCKDVLLLIGNFLSSSNF